MKEYASSPTRHQYCLNGIWDFSIASGSKGYIQVPHFFGAMEFFVHVNGEDRRVQKPSIGDGFEEQIIEACKCIREGKTQSDIMPMSESIKIMQQMDTVRKQIQLVYPFEV